MYIRKIIYIGALTSKPYAFKARPWELRSIETIDLFDALGSNIRVDIRGSDIMRILPVTNEFVNLEWISDKARYAYDGINKWRFITPMIKKNNIFIGCSWKQALSFLTENCIKRNSSSFVINTGPFIDLETVGCLKKFSNQLYNPILNENNYFNSDFQSSYIINSSIWELNSSRVIFLIGLNLRIDNPILNIRFKKESKKKELLIIYIGQKLNCNINFLHLGTNLSTLRQILEGKHVATTLITNFLKKNLQHKKILTSIKNKILILTGENLLRSEYIYLHELTLQSINLFKFQLTKFSKSIGNIQLNELNLLNNYSRFYTNKQENIIYLVGAETYKKLNPKDFLIFQGSHNIDIRTQFDIILPTTTLFEASLIYLNVLNCIQKTQSIINPPLLVRSNWKTTKMISLFLHCNIPFENINHVHHYLNNLTPSLLNNISNYKIKQYNFTINCLNKKKFSFIKSRLLNNNTSNYYLINSIEKTSKVMQICTEKLHNIYNFN